MVHEDEWYQGQRNGQLTTITNSEALPGAAAAAAAAALWSHIPGPRHDY